MGFRTRIFKVLVSDTLKVLEMVEAKSSILVKGWTKNPETTPELVYVCYITF